MSRLNFSRSPLLQPRLQLVFLQQLLLLILLPKRTNGLRMNVRTKNAEGCDHPAAVLSHHFNSLSLIGFARM